MELGLFFEFPRRPQDTEAEAFEESFAQIDMAEDLGFDSIWLAELHFSPERAVLSSPLTVVSAIAGRTKRIRIGTAVEVLPLANPIRLAEEVATVDHICRGRFELGIGRSGAPRGYIGYNIPYTESRARFYETLEVLKMAWTQENFTHHGEFFDYDDVCLVPKPFQKPHPPIRNAATSAGTFVFSAKKGMPIFIGLRGVLGSLKERVQTYQDTWKSEGQPGEPQVSLRVPVYVAETMERAHSDPEESAMNFYKHLVPNLGDPVPGLSEEENREREMRAQRMKNTTYEEVLEKDGAFGTPEVVVERLLELKETFGLTCIIAEPNFGGIIPRDRVENSMRLLAEKVAPKLR